jgi:trehalose 6-phosphate synthase
MNLVAKEFVCARNDVRGVLVLSEFTGAAQQLDAALLVNPYDIEGTARLLARALSMPRDEQSRRMRAMRRLVAQFDTYWWAQHLISEARAAEPMPIASTPAFFRSESPIGPRPQARLMAVGCWKM